MSIINLATLFSGIGTPEYALKKLNISFNNIFACEINNNARKTFLKNHDINEDNFFLDVTKLDGKKFYNKIDILVGGSPCQAFSTAGKGLGFQDTRGTLFYEYARIVKETQPQFFIYENVKGILSNDKQYQLIENKELSINDYNTLSQYQQQKYKVINNKIFNIKYGVNFNQNFYRQGYPSLINQDYDGKKKGVGKTFHIIENTFKELNYHFTWKILNTKEFGIPQNRERLYLIGFKNKEDFDHFTFPVSFQNNISLYDIIETNINEKHYLKKFNPDEKIIQLIKNKKPYKIHREKLKFLNTPTPLSADHKYAFCLDTLNSGGLKEYYNINNKEYTAIRRFTPTETAKLQGFDQDFILHNSIHENYKQFGNGMSVNILYMLLQKLIFIKTGNLHGRDYQQYFNFI